MVAQTRRGLPRTQAGPAGQHGAWPSGGRVGVVEIGDAVARGVGQGGTGFVLGAQIHQPVIRRNLRGGDEAEAAFRLGRAVEKKAAEAMTDGLERDELAERLWLYSS